VAGRPAADPVRLLKPRPSPRGGLRAHAVCGGPSLVCRGAPLGRRRV